MDNVAAIGAVASMSMADVDFSNVGKKKEEGSQLSLVGLVTLAVAGASATFAVLAMVIESSFITIIAGLTAIATTPVVLLQRFQLSKMSTFREVHNALRQDVGRMAQENTDLSNQVTRLTGKAEQVAVVEANLTKMVEEHGMTVSTFCDLIKENAKIQQKQQDLIVAQVAQQLMTSIVRADRDGDFTISEHEVTELMFHIKAIPGVENIDETALRNILLDGRGGKEGLAGIFQAIQDMYLDNHPAQQTLNPSKSRDVDITRPRRVALIKVSPRNLHASN